MTIIDFNARLSDAARPQFNVGFVSFQETHRLVDILGKKAPVANATGIDFPSDTREINADEIAFDRQHMEHFRYAMLSIIERLAKDDPSAWNVPDLRSSREGDFLRPVFNETLMRGHTMWTVLREMQNAKLPIPAEFILFLPPTDAKNPGRDDIIRSLVPFKKAQREALKAGWDDDKLVAFRITHHAATPAIVLQ